MSYKYVNHIIAVPSGEYCWNTYDKIICDYFNDDGGYPICILDFGDLTYSGQGLVEKPIRCKELKSI
jgi:hypothetical protein